jgi:hypothetical protein
MGQGRSHALSLLIFSFILCAAPLAPDGRAHAGDPYSPESILGFTRHLISRHEYYRAYVELQRLSAYSPGYIDPGSMQISSRYLLIKGKRFESLLDNSPVPGGTAAGCVDGIFSADAALSLSRFSLVPGALGSGSGICTGPLSKFRWKRLFVSSLLQNDITAAEGLLEDDAFPADLDGGRDRFRAMISWSEKRRADMADPRLALFAGVVPGLGYAVAGNRPTGVVALIVVTVFSSLTVAAFKTDNAPLGVVLGAASTFFYGGSMLGGYLEAQRNNGLAAEALREGLMDDCGLEDDRDRLFEKYGLQRKMP